MDFKNSTDNLLVHSGIEKAFAPIMSRLLRLIESRYKCKFQYRPFPNDLEDQGEQRVIYTLLSKNSSVTLDDKLLLPVRLHGHLWGYAQFSAAHKLGAKQIHEIEDLLDLVLNSALITAATLEDLRRLENEIHLSEYPPNVVRLSSFRKPQTNVPACSEGPFKQTAKPERAFSISCLIEAQSYDDIHKMAIELHYLSGCQTFVHFEDLGLGTPLTIKHLRELTSTTIFIPEVTSLSCEERITLIDWLSGPRTKESPHIIGGSVTPYAELIATDDKAQRILLHRLAVVNLKMEKSFEHYLEQGVVRFFYNSMTGKSLEDFLV